MTISEYQCRICLEEEPNDHNLIVPCLCRGTQRWVHRRCLDEWRSQDPTSPNFYRCRECQFDYTLVENPEDPEVVSQRNWNYTYQLTGQMTKLILVILLMILVISLVLYFVSRVLHVRFPKWWGHGRWWYWPLISSLIVITSIGGAAWLMLLATENISPIIIGLSVVLFLHLWFFYFVIGVVTIMVMLGKYWENSRRECYRAVWGNREAETRRVYDYRDEQESIINRHEERA